VVDDVVGGVSCDLLGHGDLGHVMDLVVDLVAEMVHGRHAVNGRGDSQGGGGRHANCPHSSHGRGGDLVDGGGRGVLHYRGGVLHNRHCLPDRIDEAILVEVLRETLQGERLVALGCGHQVTHGGSQRAAGGSLVCNIISVSQMLLCRSDSEKKEKKRHYLVNVGNHLGICIGHGGGQTTTGHGE